MSIQTGLPLLLLPLLGAARATPSARAQEAKPAPPGMVSVDGGKTPVGSKAETVVSLLEKHRMFLGPLAGETPQATIEVAPFFIQVTETTNEQYEVFVRATNRRPPARWIKGNVKEIQAKWLADEKNKGKTFGLAAYWDEHWKEHEWEVSPEIARNPVAYVSYEDAAAYARWAGMRLPTEAEWTRAARGSNGEALYPWGADWGEKKKEDKKAKENGEKKENRCAHIGNVERKDGEAQPRPAGSHLEGRSPYGAFDLVGSVWEWTSSPYKAFPGYKDLTLKPAIKGQAPEIAKANFAGGGKVVAGGSFLTLIPEVACRVTSRAVADISTMLEDLGFRCARSEHAGRDTLQWAVDRELNLASLGGIEIAPEYALALERWELVGDPPSPGAPQATGGPGPSDGKERSSPGSTDGGSRDPKGIAVPSPGLAAPRKFLRSASPHRAREAGEIPGYAVIRRYETISFAPTRKLDHLGLHEMERASLETPQILGVLVTDRPLAEPPLPAGRYTIAYRHQGLPPRPSEAAKPGGEEKGGGEAKGGEKKPPAPKPPEEKGDAKEKKGDAKEGSQKAKPGEKEAVKIPGLDPRIDPTKDLYIFRDRNGEIVGTMPCDQLIETKDVGSSRRGTHTIDRGNEVLRLYFPVVTKIEQKAFYFTLPLKFERGTTTLPWK